MLLAKSIGIEFCGGADLIPLGRHSSFNASLITRGSWYDERICDLCWWAVGKQIELLSEGHIIDHAWVVGFNGKPNEPWALVTEPYISEENAQAIVDQANVGAMAEWDVRLWLLPAARSSWNPGHCRPIVATFADRSVETFMRAAVSWALDNLGGVACSQ